MPDPSGRPATTLRRAARQEHERITAEQERVRERIDQLQAEVEALEGVKRDLAARARLLQEVMSTGLVAGPGSEKVVLRGSRLREEAVRILVTRVGIREPIGYRDWYRLLREAGFVVLAKRPLAAFLTTVSRSPLVKRGSEPGSYYVDPAVVEGLQQELREYRAELLHLEEHLATRPAGVSPLQQHRLNLMASIRRLERQVAEADRILKAHRDAVFASASRAA